MSLENQEKAGSFLQNYFALIYKCMKVSETIKTLRNTKIALPDWSHNPVAKGLLRLVLHCLAGFVTDLRGPVH